MIECATYPQRRSFGSDGSDEFRKRSGSRSDKKWARKDSTVFELKAQIPADVIKKNVEQLNFFEDERVRETGSVFAHRENFDELRAAIPTLKFNGMHIKMEDDCPQGGDDVRLCLLKTLGAYNQREVCCIACQKMIPVYDKYPLIDGTFFLSPISHYGPLIPMTFDGHRVYLQALCVRCLWHDWACGLCGQTGWFPGKSLIIGTLYTYDVLSTTKCCPPVCRLCSSPLLVGEHVIEAINNGNYSFLVEPSSCSSCGQREFHLIRRIEDVSMV